MHHETPDAHLTIFEDLGEMIPDSAFIHVIAPVDLRNFSSTFQAARNMLQQQLNLFQTTNAYTNAKWYNPDYDRVLHLTLHPEPNATENNLAGISIAHQLQEIQMTFANISAMLPERSDLDAKHNAIVSSKHKRAIEYVIGLIAAAIIGAVIGTYYGPYNQAQIDALPLVKDMDLLLHIDDQHHELLANLETRINTAFKVLNEKENDYKRLDNHISVWSAVVRHLEAKLHQFVDFVTQLQHRRLSITWFSEAQLKKLHAEVLRQAKKHDLVPLTTHLTDYFQLDVSYVRSHPYITAIIHVPCSSSDSIFKVYRYIPFPIPISQNNALQVHTTDDIIAVGHNNHHMVLSQAQLDRCQKRYHKFLCETPLITNTNFSTTCVGSLMDHDQTGIQTHCSLTSIPLQEQVFQINTNQFAIYSPDTFTGRGKCINGTALSALVSRITKVTVPSGCSFVLKQHVLTVPVNVIATSQPWVQQTKWDTMEVPRLLLANQAARHAEVEALLAKDGTFQQAVQAHLDSTVNLLKTAHSNIANDAKAITTAVARHQWAIIAIIGAVGLLLLIVCVCLCVRYRKTPSFQIPPYQLQTF